MKAIRENIKQAKFSDWKEKQFSSNKKRSIVYAIKGSDFSISVY
jgi:hypothetical protein